MNQTSTADQLCSVKCLPCEGGVSRMDRETALQQLRELSGWQLLNEPDRIRKSWQVKNFSAGMDFFHKVAELAEHEGHHPDLHLVGYRDVSIEIWTHAISGLSLNDFILAAKIDRLPIQLRS